MSLRRTLVCACNCVQLLHLLGYCCGQTQFFLQLPYSCREGLIARFDMTAARDVPTTGKRVFEFRTLLEEYPAMVVSQPDMNRAERGGKERRKGRKGRENGEL